MTKEEALTTERSALGTMPTSSIEKRLYEYPEYRLSKILMLYVPPVLIVVGTFGNLFSFVILRRRVMVKVSSYHYLAFLAVADSFVLYIGLLRLWMAELTGYDVSDSSDWACKLSISFGYIVSDLSVWLIIAVTVERYIVVCFPLRASSMINTRRAKVVIGCLALLMFSINMHFFWTVQLVERNPDGVNVTNCEAAFRYEHLVNEVWPWVDACIYSFVPCVVILILNILIIMEVVEAHSHRQRLQNTPEHHLNLTRSRSDGGGGEVGAATVRSLAARSSCRRAYGCGEGTKLTIMLLTVSFSFVLTTLPTITSTIVLAFWHFQHDDIQRTLQFRLAKTIAELLMYVNHSCNFFLYCATGHKFRQQVVNLLSCRKDSYSAPWTSLQTEETRLQQLSTKNGHHQLHLHQQQFGRAKEKHLILSTRNPSEEYSSNGEIIPLREV